MDKKIREAMEAVAKLPIYKFKTCKKCGATALMTVWYEGTVYDTCGKCDYVKAKEE